MKMLAATKVSGSKTSEQKVRHFLHKTCSEEVSGMFTLQSCKTMAKKCTKKSVLHEQSAFLLIRPIVVSWIPLTQKTDNQKCGAG